MTKADIGTNNTITTPNTTQYDTTTMKCQIKNQQQQQLYDDSESNRYYQQHKLLNTSNHSTITIDERSVWSDDDVWLVPGSISSSASSSNHSYNDDSISNDDDENDIELCSDLIDEGDNNLQYSFHVNNYSQEAISPQHYHQDENEDNLYDKIQDDSRQQRYTTTTKIQKLLSFYSDFITKTKNQEILLKLMQWSLWLLGACIVPIFPNSNVPDWIQKLSYDICYARYVTRLLGLPVALEGAMSGSWATSSYYTKSKSLDYMYQIIGQVLAYSMVVYYPVEHVAFFLWMIPNAETVLHLPAEVWFYISMRCWLVYLVAETIQYLLKYNELITCKNAMLHSKKEDSKRNNNRNIQYLKDMQQTQRRHQIHPRKNSTSDVELYCEDSSPLIQNFQNSHLVDNHCCRNDDKTDCSGGSKVTPMEINDEIYDVVLLLIRNMFYIFPCIHWSMSNWDTEPWLPDIATNGLMWMEAVLCLYQAIGNAT